MVYSSAENQTLTIPVSEGGIEKVLKRIEQPRGGLRASPDEDRLGVWGKFPPLPKRRFEIIYADPPWDYKGQLQHNGTGGRDTGGAIRHYPTVTLSDLRRLPVPEISAENCLLFMWSSSPHLDQAIDLGKSWGFAWATIAFIWHKEKTNPGFYTMSQCEVCLVFKQGKIPSPRGARNIRQFVSAPRQAHSSKPDEVRCRIEAMFPDQHKIELFARQQARSWKTWGLDA